MGKRKKARIFLVDDHPLVRERLGELINEQKDLLVCGEAAEALGCIDVLRAVGAELAIVDLSLKNSHGIDLIKDIHAQLPQLPVMVLSMHEEASYAERAMRAGARGYVTKQEATSNILTAIRQVLSGRVYLSEKMAAQLVGMVVQGFAPGNGGAPMSQFTDREIQIFELIGRGLPTREVARTLGVTVKTVDTYRARLKTKLNVGSAQELRAVAARWIRDSTLP